MTETLAFIVIALSLPVSPSILIGGGIALAVIIIVAALLILRSSGKSKGAKAGPSQGGAGWQPQQQGQQDPMGQQGWNQPGMGNPAENQWAQPQQGAWNAQPQQQQGAPGWSMPDQQQPAWGAQNPAQQPAANAWGQPSGNQWNNPAAQQGPLAPTQSANAWGTPAPGANQAWNQPVSQPAQADPWAQQQGMAPAQQQGAGGAWGTPNNPAAGQASPPFGSSSSAPVWGQPAQPPQQADQWGQPAAAQQPDQWGQPAAQQPANSWGMPGQQGQQGQQQAAYGANNAAPAWGQPAPAAQPLDQWSAPAAQPPASPQQVDQWGQPAQGGNMGVPSWQQPPQPAAPGGFGSSNPPGAFEADKTMLRPNTGSQGGTGMVRVEEGKEPGKIYEVRKDSLSIGRSRESDIFLEDLAVSRLHASIVNQGNGSYALKDEGSANGTKVNGQMVNKYQTYPLQEGDRIQLGQTVLVFTRR